MDHQPIGPAVKPQPSSLQDHIARVYYSHGLFCSSHPYSVIVTTLVVLAICCYPLMRLPLLGSSSQHFTTPVLEYVEPSFHQEESNEYKYATPRWFQGPPVGYIQQIVIKSAVSPWKPDLVLTDAFRAPLAEAFNIRELINNHQTSHKSNRTVTLSDICFQVSEPIDKAASQLLPHFQCLIVSPTNAWKHNFFTFQEDGDVTKTVLSLRDSSVDSSSLREIIFGVPWKETGIKQFHVRIRPRVITYAFTVVFQSFDANFMQSLLVELKAKYPLNGYPENATYQPEESHISHIYFQDMHAFAEFIPLGVAYTILFLYIYFSVRKIELVKSKWALAISAVMTVMMSLFMSVGLCLWFGLNPTLNGSEILPYLIVVIGLENMLVLTKSVVSTPVHLDVKLRVAQGLSKEGWSITKNLLTELALLTVAFLTFVPKIQEFCLFAVVGLLTDFFLQLVFFATFLSIDIRRIEISDLHKNYYRRKFNDSDKSRHYAMQYRSSEKKVPSNMSSRSQLASLKRKGSVNAQDASAKVFAPTSNPVLGELPKRMKFIYFWARTRMVQRGLMVCLVMWIFFWAYSSSILERLSEGTFGFATIADKVGVLNISKEVARMSDFNAEYSPKSVSSRLKHYNLFLWQSLSPQHWTTLFGYYNISLSGRYISVLPPVHLSIAISPEVASELRTPADVETSKRSYWQFLSSVEKADKDIDELLSSDLPYHPSSPAEVGLAIALALPTLLFVTYIMVVLYRCMCTRHYAEWRSSWKSSSQSHIESRRGSNMSVTGSDQYLITETLPIKLHVHSQEVENIVADDNAVVSACLNGDICVWDAISGDCLTSIKRSRLTKRKKDFQNGLRENGGFSSDSTYSSSPVSDDVDHYLMYVPSTPMSGKSSNTPKLEHDIKPCIKQFSFEESDSKREASCAKNCGYDFSKYSKMIDTSVDEKQSSVTRKKEQRVVYMNNKEYLLSRSFNGEDHEEPKQNLFYSPLPFQAIWSMDFCDVCIAIGCKEGRLEVWNAFTGNLEYIHDEHASGITALSLTENRLVAARLNGVIDFFVIELLDEESHFNDVEHAEHSCNQVKEKHPSVRCCWLQSVKAHTLTVSVLEVDGIYAVSGGFDRLVKVYKSESAVNIYTLHGHSAPISALHIDEYVPASAASGCQGGLICLWDLMTGTCMYSLKGHQGEVIALKSTSIYMISEGTDNRICIWEKCQGHLLHSISQEYSLHSNFVLLTNNIMVTAKEDNLLLWDVNHGEALRMIMVGNGDHSCYIKQLRLSGQSVVCDYGPQIFIVNFPAVMDKLD